MYKFSVAILRVSTTKQDLFTQQELVAAEIKRRGMVAVPFNIFRLEPNGLYSKPNCCVVLEDKSTGRKQSRKTYSWTMQQVKSGHVACVIACYHDRIGRNAQASLEFAEQCKKTKTELYSLSKKVDLTSAEGILAFTMLAGIAEFFSNQLSEKVKQAYQCLKEEAERTGQPFNWGGRPLGCTNKATAEQLPDLKLMIAEGKSVRHMVRVSGMDYKTVRKWRKRILAGETWTVAKD